MDPQPRSGLTRFLAELWRRHAGGIAVGDAVAAFVALQLAEIVFPAFGIGEWGIKTLVIVLGLLFPPALVLGWVFDITPTGIVRTERRADETSGGASPCGRWPCCPCRVSRTTRSRSTSPRACTTS